MLPPERRTTLFAVIGCTLLLASGCGQPGEDGPGFPVAGRVIVDGEPLTSGSVLYIPDAQRGNHSSIRLAGPIDEKGKYTLTAEGKRNCPPGYYIVVVQAFEPRPTEAKGNRSMHIRGRSLVNPNYGAPATSDLRVEVKSDAGPEDYDLRLKR
jgi:hypothetical protein